MGVKGLWQLLEPVGRPVTLESLEGKVLSVDASILLNQAVKGMRDKSGQPLPNAHLVVLFNRLCKLLFYRIKPVFVFDGGVPVLKKKTLAIRRERKFKARYGSDKAAEKLVKNYLKGKALESVTGRRSGNTIFRNKSPKEPDVFELPSLPETKSTHSSDCEEESEMSLIEEFYAQNDFENKFQDTSMINVDSEDFRSLPEEIQHELIKDKVEEKQLMGRHTMPQEAFDFSSFQLQSVLQRGKLHQRLDELRKNMNSRSTGEISGLSSQDSLGAEFSVQSRRIVSEDTAHYILVKTTKADNDDAECSAIDDTNEGGFFHDHHAVQPVKPPPAPSLIDIDLTGGQDSDSKINSPLLDVPEVEFPSLTTHGTDVLNTVGTSMAIQAERSVGAQGSNVGLTTAGDKDTDAGTTVLNTAGKSMDIEAQEGGTHAHDSSAGLYTEDQGTGDKEQSKGQDKIVLEMHDICNDNNSTSDSSIQELDEHVGRVNHNVFDDVLCEDEEKNISSASKSTPVEESDNNDAEIQKRKAQIELLLKSRQEQSTSSANQEVLSTDSSALDEDNKTANQAAKSTFEFVLHLETSEEEEDDMVDNEEILQADKRDKEVTSLPDEQTVWMMIDEDNSSETVCDSSVKDKEDASLVSLHSEAQGNSNVVAELSEFAGSSKEDLAVMQMNLEMEQNSLQSERARQARAAASVSNEMLTESQELLRLFGIPYLVSPMEAEAQCAFLDLTDQTHGTITDDSDVFLFGGQRVYKHLFNQNKHPELYTIEAISGGFALDRSKLIKLALITGSDYTEGIQGLGAVSAMEVLHEFNNEGFEALLKFKKWHDDTKDNKQKTQETKVKKKLRTMNLPTGFPSKEVFDAYINPVIDDTRGSFEWGKPDLHSLRLFAQEKLGWTTSKTDEVLLPVLKQLNKDETQKRIDSFFPIKFQESRKKASKRVRRVVNRFLNPDPLSESSSDEEKINEKNNKSFPPERKTKGKSTGSRKKPPQAVTRNSRGRGRGAVDKNKDNSGGTYDQNLLFESDGEFERLIESGLFNESNSNKDCIDPAEESLNNYEKKKDKNIKIARSEQPKLTNKQKICEDWKLDDTILPNSEGAQHSGPKTGVDTDNQRHNTRNYRGKALNSANDLIFNTKEFGTSGHLSVSEDSSTHSDSDSEEERKFRVTPKFSSGNRGIGSKRPRGRGGRGGRSKRRKTFNVS